MKKSIRGLIKYRYTKTKAEYAFIIILFLVVIGISIYWKLEAPKVILLLIIPQLVNLLILIYHYTRSKD